MASKLGMAVDLCMAYMLIGVSITFNLMQGHTGSARYKFSVELFQQQSKQQALNLLQQTVVGHFFVTMTLQVFIWLDHLVSLWFRSSTQELYAWTS